MESGPKQNDKRYSNLQTMLMIGKQENIQKAISKKSSRQQLKNLGDYGANKAKLCLIYNIQTYKSELS